MRTIGIDQSLTETGYWISLVENMHGVIKSKSKGVIERIANIRNELNRLKTLYSLDTFIIEGYSFGSRNTRFTFTAGELGGTIKLYCHDHNVKLIVVPPTLLKKFICNKGQIKKEQMLLQIYKKYGREFDNNNIADAFSLHKFYEEYIRWSTQKILEDGFTKNSIECFKKLDGLVKDSE